ncbi:ATP-grasp domain-containing protein [Fructilactobacillus florum]|uniref:ATP-grasp domain-containing protein n=1 Tax=Fructilactobacillus florum TaxID=640331 RepID=UPI0006CF9DBF|nr:ATP-grasp domain-containing protein [Fructilactobacillus florum]
MPFFDQLNVNSVPYETVVDEHDMQVATASLGFPAVLKPIVRMTRTDPFFILHQSSDIQLASQYFQAGSFVMESVVPFQQSLAVIATKDQQGEIQQFPPVVIKTFAQGQRTIYTVMDDVEAELVAEMQRITKEIGQHVDYVGTYEINFGYTATGTLYVCGVETTVSNTGYLFDLAMNINEYRQHLRAISGLPISPVKKYRDVIMQTFTRRQVPLVLELREQHPDWQFIFSYRQAALSNSYSGCLLIQTADLQQAMAELEASGLGPQTAGKKLSDDDVVVFFLL